MSDPVSDWQPASVLVHTLDGIFRARYNDLSSLVFSEPSSDGNLRVLCCWKGDEISGYGRRRVEETAYMAFTVS